MSLSKVSQTDKTYLQGLTHVIPFYSCDGTI